MWLARVLAQQVTRRHIDVVNIDLVNRQPGHGSGTIRFDPRRFRRE
jgi:hypothetical protein